MFSRSRWDWVAGLLVMLAAGCAPDAGAAPGAVQASTAVPPPARIWQAFSAGCPTLTAPPFGGAAKGKRMPDFVAPGEQMSLDKIIPGAVFDLAVCDYLPTGEALPLTTASVKIFSSAEGTTQAATLFQAERTAAIQNVGAADSADVPGLADDAIAVYFEPTLSLHARSGNAYVSVTISPSTATARTFDKLQPLQQQIPVLTAVLNDVLTGLR